MLIDQGMLLALIMTASSLAVWMAGEMFWPRRTLTQPLIWRWSNNLSLAITTGFLSHLATGLMVLAVSQSAALLRIGLFSDQQDAFWLPLLVLLALSQLISYLSHILFHHIRWLWAMHAVHHSDVDVDISTSYRHHPLEPLVFMPIVLPLILFLSVPIAAALTHQAIYIFLSVFSHSNVRLPQKLDSVLRLFVVTPDFHRVHHSSDVEFTNSNYGSIVPWYDYLFGTAKRWDFDEHEHRRLGLEYRREQSDSRLDKMLLAPLRKPKNNS
jgi:sterol desaturase/sphingolipid hydroxylase (fatty acid hydroxylase superfamily)